MLVSKDCFLGYFNIDKESARCFLLGFVHKGLLGTPYPETISKLIAKKSMGQFKSKDAFPGSLHHEKESCRCCLLGFLLWGLLGTHVFSTFFIS